MIVRSINDGDGNIYRFTGLPMVGTARKYSGYFIGFAESALTYIKVLVSSKFRTAGIASIPRRYEELVVVGNGPSAGGFLAEHREFLNGKEVLCVNRAVLSEEYTEIKPRYYTVVDPINYRDPAYRDVLFIPLAEKTDWELYLLVPFRYRKIPGWREIVERNPKVRIVYFNITPADGIFGMIYPLMKRRLAMPRPQNVLIPALMSAVWMGFRTVYTAGVEHSWHRELWVNDRNELMINDTHFYDRNTDRNIRHGSFTMAGLLRVLSVAFASYGTVERFARRRNTRIMNVTESSFIDAFERKKL